jgi:hypothetical protein
MGIGARYDRFGNKWKRESYSLVVRNKAYLSTNKKNESPQVIERTSIIF